MAHALRAGEQRVGELLRFQRDVAPDVLEPLHRVARRVLQAQDLGGALRLVAVDRLRHLPGERPVGRDVQRGERPQLACQDDGVLHGQLGSAADGEVRGVRGVAQQDEVAVAPALAADAQEGPPGVAHAMRRGIELQRVPLEPRGKHPFALGDRLRRVHAVEPPRAPRRLVAFHDEGRLPLVEAVGVHLVHPRRRLDEDEGEGVEPARRPQPDVAVGARVGARAELRREAAPHERVHAVRCNDELPPFGSQRLQVGDLVPVAQRDPQRRRALLQELQEHLARDAAEAVPPRGDRAPAHVDVDVVPVREVIEDRLVRRRVGLAEVLQRLVGEDHPPAEGVVGGIALVHRDVGAGVCLLEEERGVESRGAAPQHRDLHGSSSCTSVSSPHAASSAARSSLSCNGRR